MANTAMFHRLGPLGHGDVYLEKYSRSLICVDAHASRQLVLDCDRDVSVSDRVSGYLSVSRLPQVHVNPAVGAGSNRQSGVELTLVTTDRCNFACSYCFANELYAGSKTLKGENVIGYVERFLQLSPNPVSSFILFGGEPLLVFKAINRAWPRLQQLFRLHQGKMPSMAIVTNGSLITRDVAKFLSDNGFAVTVSLDGPKAIHDACRPLRSGQSSYERVVAGINELSRAGAYYSTEATYTSQHLAKEVSVINVVDHALELGAQEVHVMPAFPERASGIDPADNARVASLFREAAERAAHRYLMSGINELAYAARVCYAFAHDRRRRYLCTAGIDKLTIMATGEVVPCYLVCDSTHRIASCREGGQTTTEVRPLERAASAYRALARESLPACDRCWAADWCFSCYGPGYSRRGHLGAPGGLECEIYGVMVEAALLECARFATNCGACTT